MSNVKNIISSTNQHTLCSCADIYMLSHDDVSTNLLVVTQSKLQCRGSLLADRTHLSTCQDQEDCTERLTLVISM